MFGRTRPIKLRIQTPMISCNNRKKWLRFGREKNPSTDFFCQRKQCDSHATVGVLLYYNFGTVFYICLKCQQSCTCLNKWNKPWTKQQNVCCYFFFEIPPCSFSLCFFSAFVFCNLSTRQQSCTLMHINAFAALQYIKQRLRNN